MLYRVEHRRRKSCQTFGSRPVLAIFEIGKVSTKNLSFSILLIPPGSHWSVSPRPILIYRELSFPNCPSSHPFLPHLQTTLLFPLDNQMLGEKQYGCAKAHDSQPFNLQDECLIGKIAGSGAWSCKNPDCPFRDICRQGHAFGRQDLLACLPVGSDLFTCFFLSTLPELLDSLESL